MQRALAQALFLQKSVGALLAAAPRLAQQKRLSFENAFHRRAVLQKLCKVRRVGHNQHHPVAEKGQEHQLRRLLLRAREAQLKAPCAKLLQNARAVRLQNGKHCVRMLRAKRRQNLGQNVCRRNRRRAEADGMLILCPGIEQLVLQLQHMHRIIIQLPPARGDGKALCRAQKERLVQFLLQLADMGTDGGLRGIEPDSRLREAAAVGNRNKRTKLLKVHVQPPLSAHRARRRRGPRRLRC